MKHLTREAMEFGKPVTLHRIATDDGRDGTLWHGNADKAWAAWKRLAPRKGWK